MLWLVGLAFVVIALVAGLLMVPTCHSCGADYARPHAQRRGAGRGAGGGGTEPPGWDRWFVPLVGETLHFARDTVGFLAARQRRYGNVFHSHLFGQCVALSSLFIPRHSLTDRLLRVCCAACTASAGPRLC
jgi:hypothetical protein